MPAGGDTVVTYWTVADALVTRTTWHTPPSWPTRLPPLEQVVGEDYLIPCAEPVLAEVEIEVLGALPAAGLLAPGDLRSRYPRTCERYRDALNRQRQRRRRGQAELPSLPSLLRRLSASLGCSAARSGGHQKGARRPVLLSWALVAVRSGTLAASQGHVGWTAGVRHHLPAQSGLSRRATLPVRTTRLRFEAVCSGGVAASGVRSP